MVIVSRGFNNRFYLPVMCIHLRGKIPCSDHKICQKIPRLAIRSFLALKRFYTEKHEINIMTSHLFLF